MRTMIKKTLLGLALILMAALLQSTVMSPLVFYIHAVPDFTLVILVFSAYVNGIMVGQVSGFFSGLMLDFLSAAPLGMNAFIRTIVGSLAGLLKGQFFLDSFLLPMALCAGATVLKAIVLYLLHLPFPDVVPHYILFSPVFWVELGLNTMLAPLIFGLLKLFRPLHAE